MRMHLVNSSGTNLALVCFYLCRQRWKQDKCESKVIHSLTKGNKRTKLVFRLYLGRVEFRSAYDTHASTYQSTQMARKLNELADAKQR